MQFGDFSVRFIAITHSISAPAVDVTTIRDLVPLLMLLFSPDSEF
ncbi:hypothetical protein TcasGA2_TC033034 [Tribolium castaneum]|uniref:Uncharacterized protein n=1 Tax=Tribolium castaneum TaxID=7070 RepID=A0A139WHV2_TRICA|nr:hypothetical protein TcasGA2_TC033034 [Tribolium castaneum]